MLDLFLNPLLLNEAFQVGAQNSQVPVNNTGYFLTAIAALASALIYFVKRNESVIAKFDEERAKMYAEQKSLMRESIEAKNNLTSAITEMSLMHRDQHRATMEMLSQINAKT